MRVLVVTIVHHPLDARVHRRQIGALRDAGVPVTLAAPWTARGVEPPDGLAAIDLPQAAGRRRVQAVRAATRVVRQEGGRQDLVLLHDPELLAAARAAGTTPVVWDVHEDTAAAVADRPWIPSVLAPAARWGVRRAERWAERKLHLLLAEHAYRHRFLREHPVVPNVPIVPGSVVSPGSNRVVHLGRLSRGRGWEELRRLGERLRPAGVRLELLGPADPEIEDEVAAADGRGDVTWRGFVENEAAMDAIAGSMAGLALLHDLPNYRHSMPTKVAEYLAAGLPVITTPLPEAVAIVEASGCGEVVAFGDVEGAFDAVLRLRDDEEARAQAGRSGHAWATEHLNWAVEGPRFVDHLRTWATAADPPG